MVLTGEQRECYNRTISDDLVMMQTELSEGNIHDILWARFQQGDIYTFIGSVLISVNPYKKIEKKGKHLYCEDVAAHYSKTVSAELAPHIFSIAADAYSHMKNYDKNQTIVVTGESGAGKTEAAKSLMSFLTFQSSQQVVEKHFNDNGEVMELSDERVEGGRRSNIVVETGLTQHEVLQLERGMSPSDKLARALRLLQEREAKSDKRRLGERAKPLSFRDQLPPPPSPAGAAAAAQSADDDAKLLSYFQSKSKSVSAQGDKTVLVSVFQRLPHLKDLVRDGVVREDFIAAVCHHLAAEAGSEWTFSVFKTALQLVEIEVMHSDPLRKKSRKFSNFHYDDNFVVKMEYETNPLKLSALNELKSQLLESNPVLEKFGNSKTLRNDNSSRFGKYIELQFDPGRALVGGKVTTFLLEKARLVQQSAGERNFHVLHLLVEGSSPEEKLQFMLEPAPQRYLYLASSHPSFELHFAAASSQLQDLRRSLLKVGIPKHRVEDLFYLLSGVLCLGNLAFEERDEAGEPMRVSSEEELDKCSALLCVDSAELEAALVTHKFYQGQDSSYQPADEATRPRRVTMATSHHSREAACSVRDSLAKEIYNRMFVWLVETINENIDYTKANKRTVGILDIYGFEIFEMNGFEQLCINWCNEKLQLFFIDQTLRAEQKEYDNEGIPWTPIAYFDNSGVLALIELKPGIISLLDDQNTTMNTSAHKFTQAIDKTLQSNENFVSPQMCKIKTGRNELMFGVKHYAGLVHYSATHFADKNNDVLVNDLLKLMASSKSTFISKLFEDKRGEAEKLKKPPSLGTQFRKDLAGLVDTLSQCKPHYVRCIKPNETKSAKSFDRQKVEHQTRYLGLVENIKVRRAGYCYRESFGVFLHRFGMLSTLTWPPVGLAATSRAEQVQSILSGGSPTAWKHSAPLEVLSLVEGVDFRMGHTKVFVKEPAAVFALERDRRLAVHALLARAQALVRRFLQRKKYLIIRRGFVLCQADVRAFIGARRYKRTLRDVLRLQCLARRFLERCRFLAMFARFKGRPPRTFAVLLQKHVRALLAQARVRRADPALAEALQRTLYNLRHCDLRRDAQTAIASQVRGRKQRKAFDSMRMAANKIRFCMLVKLRWFRKERRIARDIEEALAAWRAPEGMRVFKCRANGTKAVEKVFRLARAKGSGGLENVFVWNAGLLSNMRGGVVLDENTVILTGGHTFKNDDVERETMVLNIKNNPFKQNDLKLQALKLQQGGGAGAGVGAGPGQAEAGRESEFRREEMVARAVTIANPAQQQELVMVFDTLQDRDRIFTVLCRLSKQFPAL